MLKAWLRIWKNIFNYKGLVSRKEYWSACIMNVIAMYVFMVPYALILCIFPISVEVSIGVFIAVFLLPMVSLYFRRANDAHWPRFYSITSKLFALSFGLFFYGGVLGMIFYDDPTAIPLLCGVGLALGTVTLIFAGIKMFFSK